MAVIQFKLTIFDFQPSGKLNSPSNSTLSFTGPVKGCSLRWSID